MRHYVDQVLNTQGLAIGGATVTVRVANATPGTGALASIYLVDSTASPVAGSVVTTDSTGTFSFYAPDGRYDLTVVSGTLTKIVGDLEIADITETNSGDVGAIFTTPSFTTGFRINGAAPSNQVPVGNGTNYIPTALSLASGQFANQGTTVTVLHGNAAGNPSFAVVTPADAAGNTSGSGNFALTTSPVFTTPNIGVATAANGTAGTPGLNFAGSTSSGLYYNVPSSFVGISIGGTTATLNNGSWQVGSARVYGFTSTADASAAGNDTGLSRTAAGTLAIGNGTQGDTTGIVKANQYVGGNVGGQRSAAFLAQATGSIGFGWSSSGAGTDQKDWDVFADATPRIQFRTVNEANNSAVAWLTVNRGAATAVSSIIFGNGGNSQTLFTANDTIVGRTTTDTLTNKRVTPRITTLASSTTLTSNSDTDDVTYMNMTGVAGTLTIASPTGTPTDGQKLIIRIKATNAQTYSFNAAFRFSTTVTAPTSISAAKTDYIGCMWIAADSKWDVVAVDQGH